MTLALPSGLRLVRLLKETPDSVVALAHDDSNELVVARRSPLLPPDLLAPLAARLEPLRHAGLQPVLRSEDGWMVSRYLAGPTADEAPALGLAAITRGIIHLLSAISYLDSHQVTPRYADPTDILVHEGGMVLLDLGWIEGSHPEHLRQFSTWHLAPEVRSGHPADHRSAIYSLGTVAWWLLTRAVPRVDPSAQDLWETLNQTRPEVPRGWADVFLWMLNPSPSQRPQSGLDALQTLSGWLRTAADNDTWITADLGRAVLEMPDWASGPLELVTAPDGRRKPESLPVGQTPMVGMYRLTHLLGQGGTARVYAAVALGQSAPVALKLLQPKADVDPELRLRFKREMQVSAGISHPNVCHIMEGGETDSGQLYLVMELLEGEILTDTIDRLSPMPWGLVRPIVQQLIAGVEAIHQAGIIHRDLKPGNIFLTRDGLKIMDFGIARRPGEQSITKAGMVLGSPGFLSHEQLVDTKRVDQRTDLYNIGILTYQMLSRHLPYEGGKHHEVLVRILTQPATPLTDYRRDLPEVVVDWVTRLIEKNADHRYQTITEVRATLPD